MLIHLFITAHKYIPLCASLSVCYFNVTGKNPLMNVVVGCSHLMGMFYRTIRMLENGIKPVYVFDGKPPEMKSGEVHVCSLANAFCSENCNDIYILVIFAAFNSKSHEHAVHIYLYIHMHVQTHVVGQYCMQLSVNVHFQCLSSFCFSQTQ